MPSSGLISTSRHDPQLLRTWTLCGKTASFKINMDWSECNEKEEHPEHHISHRLENTGCC